MKKINFVLAPALLALLTACGGGGADPVAAAVMIPAVSQNAAVSAISTTQALSYGKSTQINITGTNLDQPFTLSAPGCTTLAEVAGGSATAKSYTCQVGAAGTLAVTASSSVGELLAVSLAVPDPQVSVITSMGTFVLELNPAKAPLSVDNFLKYTGAGFYTNLLMHRVVANFVVQGGGFAVGDVAKTTLYAPLKLESDNGLSNLRGTLGMARQNAPDTATSQFFINVADNLFLNYASAAAPGYAVFGKVVDGMAVVDAIALVPTGARSGLAEIPLTDVLITSALQTR
jgi:peptidyl-prolyl cis-trans isomerase A (cyclophilin A)